MHRVVVLALQGVIPFDMAIPFQVFADARDRHDLPLYDVALAGSRQGQLTTSAGFAITVPRGLSALAQADTIVAVGSEPAASGVDRAVRSALCRAAARGVRILSICTGAYVLAEAGLLDGRRATTHWRHRERFGARYPLVDLDAAVLYTHDGQFLTSAGAAAGIDLCLHVVALDHGMEAANLVARATVSPPHRSGGQAQFIEQPFPQTRAISLEESQNWARQHLDQPIRLDDLAGHAAVSRRTLVRRFASETGTTPLQWLIEERLRLARRLLEETSLSVEEIAQRCGLGSAATLRFHFRRTLATSPTAYRQTFG